MDWIIPSYVLANSPSRDDNISADVEKASRYKTAWFMEEMVKRLLEM